LILVTINEDHGRNPGHLCPFHKEAINARQVF
jgi:hypothetical protein